MFDAVPLTSHLPCIIITRIHYIAGCWLKVIHSHHCLCTSSTLVNQCGSCNVSCHVFLDLHAHAEDDWSHHFASSSLFCFETLFMTLFTSKCTARGSLHRQIHSKRFKQTRVHVQLNRLDLFGRAMLARTGLLCVHMSSVCNVCPHVSLAADLQPETA